MELHDYLRIMRKRWRVITAATVLTLLVAGAVTFFTPKQYESVAQLFVSTQSSANTAELAAGSNFTQKQVKTYADLAKTPKILRPVVLEQHLDTTSAELADRVTATVPVDTVLINIAVRQDDPETSARVALAIANKYRVLIPELETVETGKASPVKVTLVQDPAPGEQVQPTPARNMALGLVLGLLIGLGLALLRDRMDTSIKNEKDVQELTDGTIIGGIPFDTSAEGRPLIVQADGHGPRAEAMRSVRTNLQFIDVSNPPRAFAITSSLPGEGKTTTAANLAMTIAAGGASVCVIEGDLRRSRLLSYMGLESGVGLTNVLIGEADLDDVLQPFAGTDVHVLGAGPVPPNPSELLGSDKMREVFADLRRRFDYVIIDTPPLLPVTDAAVVSKLVDGAVLIVGAGIINREHLERSLEILDTVGVRLLGMVINRLPMKGSKGGYGYSYYGGYYSHGSSPGHSHSVDRARSWRPATSAQGNAAAAQCVDVARVTTAAAPTGRAPDQTSSETTTAAGSHPASGSASTSTTGSVARAADT